MGKLGNAAVMVVTGLEMRRRRFSSSNVETVDNRFLKSLPAND
jgi:hypothetical protein